MNNGVTRPVSWWIRAPACAVAALWAVWLEWLLSLLTDALLPVSPPSPGSGHPEPEPSSPDTPLNPPSQKALTLSSWCPLLLFFYILLLPSCKSSSMAQAFPEYPSLQGSAFPPNPWIPGVADSCSLDSCLPCYLCVWVQDIKNTDVALPACSRGLSPCLIHIHLPSVLWVPIVALNSHCSIH